jgi:DNA-binding CsgD family transcriptional regulator
MLLVDDDRRFIEANPAACRLLRCERDELLAMRIDDLAAGTEDVAGLWRAFLDQKTQSGRFEIARPDGTRVGVSYSATAHVSPGVHLSVLLPIEEANELDDAVDETRGVEKGARLTQREREVMTLLALGATPHEIADRLVISRETVRNHTRNARDKLEARTRAQAIAVALDRREIEISRADERADVGRGG